MQQWRLHIENLNGENIDNAKISVGGGMPAHNHGLPTAPKVTEYLGDGRYLVEGIKFHMSGHWQLKFEVTIDNYSETVTFDLEL